MPQNDPVQREVIATFPKGDDMELHVSMIEVDGAKAVDVRDFIVSTGRYGRNGLIPLELLPAVRGALAEVK